MISKLLKLGLLVTLALSWVSFNDSIRPLKPAALYSLDKIIERLESDGGKLLTVTVSAEQGDKRFTVNATNSYKETLRSLKILRESEVFYGADDYGNTGENFVINVETIDERLSIRLSPKALQDDIELQTFLRYLAVFSERPVLVAESSQKIED